MIHPHSQLHPAPANGRTMQRIHCRPAVRGFAHAAAACLAGLLAAVCPAMAGPPLFGPETIVEPADPVSSNGTTTRFGRSVALEGDVLVVGSMDDVAAAGQERGAVFVFERIGGLWTQQQKLLAPDGADGDEFGFALDLALDPDGMMDWLIVGAPKAGRISAGPDGRVYLFRRANGGAWTFDSQLFPNPLTEEHSSEFGHGVGIDISEPVNSLTGDLVVTAVVGSPRYEHPTAGGSNHGAIHIYQRVGSPQSFQLSHELYGRNPNPGRTFDHSMQLGWSVAIDRGLIIAGAPIYYASQHQSGAGVLYGRQNQLPGGAFHWVEASFLEASSAFQQDHLGRSTALSFDTMVGLVGTELYDGQGFASSSGTVYAFDLSTFGLMRTEVQQLLPSDDAAGNQFGASVDIDGRIAVIGAPGVRAGNGNGAVYLFAQTSGQPNSWVEIGKISPTGLDAGWSDVGRSVAVSAFTTAYGVTQRPGVAPGNEGAVYLNEVVGIYGDGFE